MVVAFSDLIPSFEGESELIKVFALTVKNPHESHLLKMKRNYFVVCVCVCVFRNSHLHNVLVHETDASVPCCYCPQTVLTFIVV